MFGTSEVRREGRHQGVGLRMLISILWRICRGNFKTNLDGKKTTCLKHKIVGDILWEYIYIYSRPGIDRKVPNLENRSRL